MIRLFYLNHIYGEDFSRSFEGGGFQGQVDIPRLKDSEMGGTFWSAFMPCPKNNGSDFADENYHEGSFFLFGLRQTNAKRPPDEATAHAKFLV